MKYSLVLISVLAACHGLSAQGDAKIKLPQDAGAILEMAAPFYNYDPANAKPWRLSYQYKLLDSQGTVSAEGTVEFWWSPNQGRRITWTKGNNVHTEWRTSDGKTLQSVTGDDISSMEHRLGSAVLFSLPKAQDFASGETTLKLVRIENSGVVNLCVAQVPSKSAANSQADNLHGVGTAYCFDSQAPVLVSTLQNHTITNSYSHIQKFLDHNIAGHIDISYGGEKKLEADLEECAEIKADDAAFAPSADAKEPPVQMITVKKLPIITSPNGEKNAGVKPGALLVRVPPIYPPGALASHISGIVVIQAMIGKDGSLQNPRVVSSPDESLSQAALDAVRQWRYQPYMLNDQPVSVMTTINVSFSPNH